MAKEDKNHKVAQTVAIIQLVYQHAGPLHESPWGAKRGERSTVLSAEIAQLVAKEVAFMLCP